MFAGLVIPKSWYLIAGLVLALCTASVAALWQHSEATRYQGIADGAIVELEAAQARLARVQKAVRRSEDDAATARLQLEKALDGSPAWSAQPVPAAVAAGLCKHARCAGVRSVPAPTDSN